MDTNKQKQLDLLYLDIAKRVSQMSCAKRSKVGCVIVKDDRILSMGFNGTPSGFDNECEFTNDKNELETKKEVLHSESNAITKIAKSTESCAGSTLYITLGTCVECAKLIIQSGIKRVVYLEEYRDASGIELLKKTDIIVEKFNLT